jgi:hypothetical protein
VLSRSEVVQRVRRSYRLSRDIAAFRTPKALVEYCRTGSHSNWGGPMNGQRLRREAVRRLGGGFGFAFAVETGTYRGTTTAFLADVLGCDVWSVELIVENARFARRRLYGRDDIHLARGDSTAFLRSLPGRVPPGRGFFYLDAHWEDDLPLWDELAFVLGTWPEAFVMIDDFEVPDDDGYGYDDYGPGKRLHMEALTGLVPDGCDVWSPTARSEDETGARRGFVLLAPAADREAIAGLGVFRPAARPAVTSE